MVDVERLVELLGRVTQRLVTLEDYAQWDPTTLVADERAMGHLKYTFQTAIEACLDAAHHVVAADGLGTPRANADAFERLGRGGVIPDDLAETMAEAARFRNVLVHGYAEVEDDRVVAHLDQRDALRELVDELARYAREA